MKTAYQEYMDWQTVSSDLHSKLLALELEQKASVPAPVRPLKLSRHGWHRVAAPVWFWLWGWASLWRRAVCPTGPETPPLWRAP